MRDDMVYSEYSENRDFRFEVYGAAGFYEVWLQRKVTDEYMGPDWFAYYDISDDRHLADTLERAIEIGRVCIRDLL